MSIQLNDKYPRRADIFWHNLETIMKIRKISWKELADNLGANPHTLASKKCAKANVSIETAAEIAEAVGTSVDRLLFGNPESIH